MLRHSFLIPHSADEVLAAHRDGLPGFGAALPSVASIDRVRGVRQGSVERVAHRWQADPSVLPGILRRVVPPEHFCWHDDSAWDEAARTGSWAITIDALGNGPHVRGTHRFVDAPGGCEVHVEAELLFLASPDTTIMGIRAGRILAPLLQRAVQEMFKRLVTHSGAVVSGWIEDQQRVAA